MQQLPGKTPGSFIYVYKGYSYSLDHRSDKSKKQKIFRCTSRRSYYCRATVTKQLNGTITVKRPHNHAPDDKMVEKRCLKDEMLRICKSDMARSLKEIFDTVCETNPEAAKGLSYKSLRSTMQRGRARALSMTSHSYGVDIDNNSMYNATEGDYYDSQEDHNESERVTEDRIKKELNVEENISCDTFEPLVKQEDSYNEQESFEKCNELDKVDVKEEKMVLENNEEYNMDRLSESYNMDEKDTSTGITSLYFNNDNSQPQIVVSQYLRKKGICCKCLTSPITHIFVPCGHFCICHDCYINFNDDFCPICDMQYNLIIKVIYT